MPHEPALFVGEFEGHNVLLNKFSIVRHHALLTTKGILSCSCRSDRADFQSQFQPPGLADFKAAFRFLKETQFTYFAFYNCGPLSGASLPHRHLQFLPLEQGEKIPIEAVLLNNEGGMSLLISGTIKLMM